MIKRLVAVTALFYALAGSAQNYQPIVQPHITFTDGVGNPCSLCFLQSYAAGTTTPIPTYTDSTGFAQNPNPVPLDAAGGASIWLATGTSYKFVLQAADHSTIWTVDNVVGGLLLSGLYLPLTGGTLTGALNGTTGTFSGAVQAGVFNGPGTGLTGTAAALNIGGNSATTTHASNLPADFATQSAATPSTGKFTTATVTDLEGGVGAVTPAAGAFTTLSGSTSIAVAGGTAMTANQGNGTSVQHSTGATVSGHLVKYDANGNTVDSGVAAPAATSVDQYFTATLCAPATSTDSQCTGTVSVSPVQADSSYFVSVTVNSNGGTSPGLLFNVNGSLSTSSIPYSLTCTFNCGTINTPTAYVHIHHN